MLPGLGGWLGPVERVEQTGEGRLVGCETVPPTEITRHFTHYVGLAGVIPFLVQVIFNADGEQYLLSVGLRLLQFPDLFFKSPYERTRRTKSQRAQLGGKSHGIVNKSPAIGFT